MVHGGDSRGGERRRLELHGDLLQVLEFGETAGVKEGGSRQNARKPQSGETEALIVVSLVAGAGFEPATFRL